MSSYPRRHNGQPRPPPARNRPGRHSSSPHHHQTGDPGYIAYLRSQAAQINSQISALSEPPRVTPSPPAQPPYSQDHSYDILDRQSRSRS